MKKYFEINRSLLHEIMNQVSIRVEHCKNFKFRSSHLLIIYLSEDFQKYHKLCARTER